MSDVKALAERVLEREAVGAIDTIALHTLARAVLRLMDEPPNHVAVWLTPTEWQRVYHQLTSGIGGWHGPITDTIAEAALEIDTDMQEPES